MDEDRELGGSSASIGIPLRDAWVAIINSRGAYVMNTARNTTVKLTTLATESTENIIKHARTVADALDRIYGTSR